MFGCEEPGRLAFPGSASRSGFAGLAVLVEHIIQVRGELRVAFAIGLANLTGRRGDCIMVGCGQLFRIRNFEGLDDAVFSGCANLAGAIFDCCHSITFHFYFINVVYLTDILMTYQSMYTTNIPRFRKSATIIFNFFRFKFF